MEISIGRDNNVKIKGANATIIIDPVSKAEAQIVILTSAENVQQADLIENKRLVIIGPGDYEAGGISIAGNINKGEHVFSVLERSKIFWLRSSSIKKIQEDDEFDCVLINVDEKVQDDAFSVFNAKCFVLYGDLDKLVLKADGVEKSSKINLRKINDTPGKIVLLSGS